MATVFLDSNYLTVFNSPRAPQVHTLKRSRITGVLGRAWRPLDGIAVWNPLQDADLLHTFNRIPLVTSKPWIVSFESILPRCYGKGCDTVRSILRERLLSPQCRKIIAISDYSIRRMKQPLANWSGLTEVMEKTVVVHPNFPLGDSRPVYTGGTLSLLFVGNDFARKGGIAALRIAKIAQERSLPIHVHIVSSMRYGNGIYTDCKDRRAYAADLSLLSLDNVTFHGPQPNHAVMSLIRQSHFVLLPTLHDTYGFSPLEGMSQGVPVIASTTAAIPEFVKHEQNGYLLPLSADAVGDWDQLPYPSWDALDYVFSSMAESAIGHLRGILDEPSRWTSLSHGATSHMRQQHCAEVNGARLEQLYSSALST